MPGDPPPCTPVKEKFVALSPMVEVGAGAVDVDGFTVDVVGGNTWVNPGMAVSNF